MAIEANDPRAASMHEACAEVARCFTRWSEAVVVRWVVELAVDSCCREDIEEAARVVARSMREPSVSDFVKKAAELRRRRRGEEKTADLMRTALPSSTGGRREAAIMSGVMDDLMAKAIPPDSCQTEYDLRRGMTDEEIEAHRAILSENTAPQSSASPDDDRRQALREQADNLMRRTESDAGEDMAPPGPARVGSGVEE
jgi:hypothetical protein